MTAFLLDVNVLIALIDPAHVQHDQAHDWFARTGHTHFATCPITENGLLRIVGHPRYPNSPGPPSVVAQSLAAIRALPGHEFWPDSISIADNAHVAPTCLSSHARVTDSYLLALAQTNGGRLATMDRKLATEVLPHDRESLDLI
ncbi:MAG: TA system VapC family ribonuclease toxin [Candidatus Competibacter denitrificans]